MKQKFKPINLTKARVDKEVVRALLENPNTTDEEGSLLWHAFDWDYIEPNRDYWFACSTRLENGGMLTEKECQLFGELIGEPIEKTR